MGRLTLDELGRIEAYVGVNPPLTAETIALRIGEILMTAI